MKRSRPKYPPRELLAERAAWAERFDRCWVCGVHDNDLFMPLETHEIASKAKAPKKWADPRNYFRTCNDCHSEVLSWLPESVQMVFKLQHDPDNYDRQFINRLRHEADDSISEGEVKAWRKFVKAVGR